MTNDAIYAATLRASKNVVAKLRPSLDRLLKILNLSADHLVAEELSNGGICLRLNLRSDKELPPEQSVLLRLKASPESVRIEFPAAHSSYYASKFPLEPYQVDAFNVAFVDPFDLNTLSTAVCRDLQDRLLHYPPSFNHCPIYQQCRSSGYCVAPDQDSAVGCAYRRTLYQGLSYFKGITTIK